MWDYSQPEASEQRFRAAMASASGDDVLNLQTQIARTQGLRRQFHQARALLQQIEPAVRAAGPEVRARHALELGRTHCSATHAAEERTPEARERARQGFEAALAIARSAELDALAIDAIHMLAFVDPAPVDQLKWGEQALAVVLASSQPEARRWEASVRNNLGTRSTNSAATPRPCRSSSRRCSCAARAVTPRPCAWPSGWWPGHCTR